MKYARDTRPFSQPTQMAELLSETLPWIKNIAGKTVVIKYGGAAMENAALQNAVMSDIVLLKLFGVNPIIVHGGGKAINRAMAAQHLEVQFANGRRVTTPETMEVVRQVLVGEVNQDLVRVGEVNQDLVRAVNAHGNLAVGVSGADAGTFVAHQLDPELGRVGEITKVNTGYLEDLIRSEYIPVVATVALGDDGGYYNVNADTAAGYVAAALGAHKIVFLTDVDGLYEDFDDKSSLISNMTLDECRSLRDSGNACIRALEAGVFRAHIINGTAAHSLLIELLTDEGVGTVVHATEEAYELDTHPLGKVAARLMVNLSEAEARKGLA